MYLVSLFEDTNLCAIHRPLLQQFQQQQPSRERSPSPSPSPLPSPPRKKRFWFF
ncbi:hypothetical protein P3342_013397 [Pyrenophora teres f. teres]|nr:hypothetical protein P3342_013397 [Pyrenophora teres f. teres]